jgi:integrase
LAFLITEEAIDDYRYEVARRLSNPSANRRLFIIKQVFKKALRMKLVPEDPTKDLGYLSEKKHERNRYLQPDEIVKLVKCAQKTRGKYYLPAIILLGADYGAAIQEVLDLSWRDVDFKKKTIRFYRTKNRRERTMALKDRSAQALQDWWDHLTWMRNKKNITEFKVDKVFCHLNGEPFKEIRNSWKEACRLANIRDFRVHDLRHTYCTNLLESGADLADVMEMVGHSSLRMARRYTHVTSKRKKRLQNGLEQYYLENSNF